MKVKVFEWSNSLRYIRTNLYIYLCRVGYASLPVFQNHWFTYNERMSVESVTQAVSNLALQFGDDDADPGAMVGLIKFDCVKLKLLKGVM